MLAETGTVVLKFLLHISKDEQRQRLQDRIDDPTKHWKFAVGDLEERARWDAYQEAYQAAVTRCSSEIAPWYVVPADRKWYARLAVMNLLDEHLAALGLQWPVADFDVEEQKARLAAT